MVKFKNVLESMCLADDAVHLEPASTRVVFILSSYHSGSTWIGYVLGSTPDSAFLGEYSRAWDEQRRVPCTICAGRGFDSCQVLQDIGSTPVDEGFALAAARTGKRILIDNSKSIDWTNKFIHRGNLDFRIVHVVKDPRSWFASVRRRQGGTLADAIDSWCQQNRDFQALTASVAGRGATASYDLLAGGSRRHLRHLFHFCGLPYSDRALHYWDVEHHGFAANGASDAVIKRAGLSVVPMHFATADDAFYEQNSQRLFLDDRWRAELTLEEEVAIRRHPAATALLASLGYRLTRSGIVSLPFWSRLGPPRRQDH